MFWGFFMGRNKSNVVLSALLFLYPPPISTPKSQEMLQTGGVRSVLNNTEVKPGFIYFVGMPRITQKSRSGLLFRSLHVHKENTVYSRAVTPVFKVGSGDNLATVGKYIWKTHTDMENPLPSPLQTWKEVVHTACSWGKCL